MTIRIINFFLLVLVLSVTACLDYETQFEGPYEDQEEELTPVNFPRELVYVAGGNVYLADKFGQDSLILDNSGTVEIASINNDHTKVIFKRSDDNIKIYDIEVGSITDEIPGTATAIWYDYHANNKTIYFLLSDGNLDTYGPDILSSKPINLSSLSPQIGAIIQGVAIFENGDFIFSSRSSGFFGNNSYLFTSDGNDILTQGETNVTRRYLRINHAQDRLWMGDRYDYFLHKYRLPAISKIDSELNRSFGTPTTDGRGYELTEDNIIRTPLLRKIESPGGDFSSVDF